MPQGGSMFAQWPKDKQCTIQVFVRLHNGNGCMMPISSLKIVSQTQLELPNQFQLVFQGKCLTRLQATLTSLGLVSGSIIHIDTCHSQDQTKLKLDVCFFYKGEKMVIRAGREQTIRDLKTKLYRLIGILPKNQMIIFRGTRLQDQQTLAFYHIAEDSLLCLHTAVQTEEIVKSETPFDQTRDLILATVSANFSRGQAKNNLNMFRSESMGIEKQPYEIEIREENKEQLLQSRQFKFELLNPMPTAFISQLTESVSNKQNNSQVQYKILVNAKEVNRGQLMII